VSLCVFRATSNGKPQQFYVVIPEYRYHFNEKIQWLLCWVHIGGTVFFQKWNYLNTDNYEKGFGYVMETTIGYQTR
jgi:hypothetical protein